MTGTRIAGKYATAIFGLARKAQAEPTVWADLVVLRDVLAKEPRFLEFLAAPQVPDEDKLTLVRTVLKDVSQPMVRDFVLFLVDKARADHLPEIIRLFGQMWDEAQGIVEATITSAVPLNDQERDRIVARLERISGKKVRHKLEVDPDILGGVVVLIGGEIIDHSVRHDLARLRDQLRSIKVHEAA
ncbi:MAG: F0F1 ATP synthase subunit delta [candidate division Zixibacteria bacterium]|nr:F0F1 ATP synthase subunit delta [candidate division Zixibacteria bacterium]